MYAGPASHVDREEYLLGKRIDRQIDPLLASEEKEKEVRRREGVGRGEGVSQCSSGGRHWLLDQAHCSQLLTQPTVQLTWLSR